MSVLSGQSYSTLFDCKDYLSLYCGPVKGNPDEEGDFHMIQAHKFYTKYSTKWNNKSARLMEFGGGPVITSLISAVPFVHQITFAAYTESERKEIELWKNGEDGAHDWSSHFKYNVCDVENIAGDDAWREREDLLRKCITSIVPCDIFCDNPLLVEHEPFEIVSTNLCLEAACSTYSEYKEAIKKLVGLLKLGGFLVMLIVDRKSFYINGGKKWSSLPLTLEQVKEALIEAGTAIVVAKRDPAPMERIQTILWSDYKGMLFVAAQKVEG